MNKTTTAVLTRVIPESPVFTTRAVATAADVSPAIASRDLARLAEQRIVKRIAAGIWADVRHPDFSPYSVVPYLLQVRGSTVPGYISLLSALNLRGLIQQIPRTIQVIVLAPRRTIRTPVGTYEFHQIDSTLFGGFEPFGQLSNCDVATAEKALFDTMYLSVRRAKRFSHLPEVEFPGNFRVAEIERWIGKIRYASLRIAVASRWRVTDHLRRSAAM